MRAALAILALATLLGAQERTFEVTGQFTPGSVASVALYGAVSPYFVDALSDSKGRFHFSKVPQGQYNIVIFQPGIGETRKTIEVTPSNADAKGRIFISLLIDPAKVVPDRSALVSVRELQIPKKAWKEYFEAEKDLSHRNSASAVAHLKQAVELEPKFVAAWNTLGTISYQTREYAQAEDYFRKALEIDPGAFEPLVNLGGTLLSLGKLSEAWNYNLHAVLMRPDDPLANSQLGMTYFEAGRFGLAEKYLLAARKLDPGHFSHPQLMLAEIYLHEGRSEEAADQLEDFLRHHPDWPSAARMRSKIAELRNSPKAD
jgi:tetratricopeptide (TPR) repeat protein